MQTIKTNGREIVAVEVPFNLFDFTITESNFLWWRFRTTHNWDEDNKVELPAGCKIIGLLSELTEEQCKPYINNYFFDVKHKLNTSIEKLILILKSHDIDTTKPLLIIEKLKYNEPRPTQIRHSEQRDSRIS